MTVDSGGKVVRKIQKKKTTMDNRMTIEKHLKRRMRNMTIGTETKLHSFSVVRLRLFFKCSKDQKTKERKKNNLIKIKH